MTFAMGGVPHAGSRQLSIYVLFFWPEAHRTLAPQPGMEPRPSAVEAEVLTAGPPGKSWWVWLPAAFLLVSDCHLPVYRMSSGASGVKFNSARNSQTLGVL